MKEIVFVWCDSGGGREQGGGTRYYYSGFFGGSSRHFLAMASEVAAGTEVDLTRGIVARVHDESHVNRCVPDGGKSRLSAMQVTAVRVFLTVESHGQ